MGRVDCRLKDPFPVDVLSRIDLGNADGHRDSLVEKGFVVTKAVKKFMSDKHSVIVGSFGSGKSALFHLLKNGSDLLKEYQDAFVVTIDEQLQFDELRSASATYFPSLSSRLTYLLLWKFQICRRISEEVARLEAFPCDENEEYISEFLARSGGIGGYQPIISRIKSLFETVSIKLKAKLSSVPVETEITKESIKATKRVELNLDEVIDRLNKIFYARNIKRCIVAIDKLDKFVSGEDYTTQREFIESLLLLEDDLYDYEKIGFKIFLRSDLYERLDFSSLGPDKADDNALRLVWSREEIRQFIARRLYEAFHEAGVWNSKDILESSDLSELKLRWYEKIKYEEIDGYKYVIACLFSRLMPKRRNTTTLAHKFDNLVINKLFEKNLVHECADGSEQKIPSHEFFDTHFLDGNDSCTPRYILVFLKELLEETNDYFVDSPNDFVVPEMESGDWVYNLFRGHIVYKSYLQAKEKYIRHICKIDDKWTSYLLEFLGKQGAKKLFDFGWVSKNVSIETGDKDVETFIIYLQVIGFFKVKKYHRSVKKRTFELPVLYKVEKGAVSV